jgi:hypothetical protein
MMKQSRTTWLAACFVVLLGLPTVGTAAPDGQEEICATPAVIFCDNFEARSVGAGDLLRPTFKSLGWPASDAANITVTDDPAGVYRGRRALQFRYPAGAGGIGFVNPPLASAHRTVYMRWYTKWSASYVFSSIATKHVMLLTPSGSSMYMFWSQWGNDLLKHFAQFGGSTVYEANVNGPFPIVRDRWYCLELRVTANTTADSLDGHLQGWIDGVPHWEYSNRNLDSFLPNLITSFDVSGYWNCSGPACDQPSDQHPLMHRWHDNFVVSTERIGCLAGTDSGGGATITAVTPPSGSTTGGATVDILGNGFSAESTVMIGGRPAAASVNNAGWIRATTPPGAAGAADVTVSQPSGATVAGGGYNYLPPDTVVLRDDFADGNAAGWQSSPLGNAVGWRVVNGLYTYDGTGHTQSYRGEPFWSDYAVEASIRLTTLGGYPGGIRGRVDAITGRAYAVWLLPATGEIVLCRTSTWHIDGAGRTVLAVARGIPFDTTAFHTVRATFVGSTIEVAYDGVTVIRVTDPVYASGLVALDVSNQFVDFDDVTVRTLP